MIRPSSLPKLAECPCYEGTNTTSPAAERGTMLDALIREYIATGTLDVTDTAPEDVTACDWTADTIRQIADGSLIKSDESSLWVDICGLGGGTMDILIPEKQILCDIKSGQIRSYYHQMAAYALGCMDRYYVGEWTAILVFCDQQKIITHQFTYESAKDAVNSVLARVNDPQKQPTPCDYCDWCAKSATCSARLQLAESAVSLTSDRFELLLQNPVELGKFLTQCSHLDSFREKAKEKVRALLESGESVEGWKLRKGSQQSIVFPEDLATSANGITWQQIAMSNGAMSATKAKKLWDEVHPDTQFPQELIKKTAPNKPSLVQA